MKEEIKEGIRLALEAGFEHAGELNVSGLVLYPAVREMCSSGNCHVYGKNWRCPPYCGTLEELEEKIRRYTCGILVQSTAELEDEFDGETMIETEKEHKKRFYSLIRSLGTVSSDILPLSAGTCTLCPKCSCPDEPCRHPDFAFSSMEACGLNVSEVCAKSDIPYYYGKLTITYSSCILLP